MTVKFRFAVPEAGGIWYNTRMADEIFGYSFKNAALLDEALTTPSCRMSNRDIADNQRLEFLGDAVLGFLAADELFSTRVHDPEGELTVRRTRMVSAAALCAAAEHTDLVPRLKRNRGAAPLSPHAKTVADAVEAVIGAAYLDGGLDAARAIFRHLALAARAHGDGWQENPKGELQIFAQAMTPPHHPAYRLLKTEGKSHEPVFTVEVAVDGLGVETASARTRQEAEARAAAKLLAAIRRKPGGGKENENQA